MSVQLQGLDDHIEVRRARLFARGDCLLVLPVSYQIEAGYVPNQFYIQESYVSRKGCRQILKCLSFGHAGPSARVRPVGALL